MTFMVPGTKTKDSFVHPDNEYCNFLGASTAAKANCRNREFFTADQDLAKQNGCKQELP